MTNIQPPAWSFFWFGAPIFMYRPK